MKHVYSCTRRIVSVVVLAMLVLADGLRRVTLNLRIDPQAEKLLRRMNDYLASRQQFTLKAESTLEVVLTSGRSCSMTVLQHSWCCVRISARPSQG